MDIGSQRHPTADTALDLIAAYAGMLTESLWLLWHVAILAGFVVVGVALFGIIRRGPWSTIRSVKLLGWMVLAGAVMESVDITPHMLVNTEIEAVLHGGSTLLNNIHGALQALGSPVP